MLEKLDLAEIIVHSPEGQFLYELDLPKLFSPEEKEVEEVKVSTVESLDGDLINSEIQVASLLEALRLDVGEVKGLVQNVEHVDKPAKMVQPDSFKRLQEKVKDHGDLLTKLKGKDL